MKSVTKKNNGTGHQTVTATYNHGNSDTNRNKSVAVAPRNGPVIAGSNTNGSKSGKNLTSNGITNGRSLQRSVICSKNSNGNSGVAGAGTPIGTATGSVEEDTNLACAMSLSLATSNARGSNSGTAGKSRNGGSDEDIDGSLELALRASENDENERVDQENTNLACAISLSLAQYQTHQTGKKTENFSLKTSNARGSNSTTAGKSRNRGSAEDIDGSLELVLRASENDERERVKRMTSQRALPKEVQTLLTDAGIKNRVSMVADGNCGIYAIIAKDASLRKYVQHGASVPNEIAAKVTEYRKYISAHLSRNESQERKNAVLKSGESLSVDDIGSLAPKIGCSIVAIEAAGKENSEMCRINVFSPNGASYNSGNYAVGCGVTKSVLGRACTEIDTNILKCNGNKSKSGKLTISDALKNLMRKKNTTSVMLDGDAKHFWALVSD
ncbi:MAG: hypothetical protein LBB18_01695 [Puniceicoccales bacterium]|jgi:hypothetical protein|nr:hypothetical protein [Puniceicoccales bacterium]